MRWWSRPSSRSRSIRCCSGRCGASGARRVATRRWPPPASELAAAEVPVVIAGAGELARRVIARCASEGIAAVVLVERPRGDRRVAARGAATIYGQAHRQDVLRAAHDRAGASLVVTDGTLPEKMGICIAARGAQSAHCDRRHRGQRRGACVAHRVRRRVRLRRARGPHRFAWCARSAGRCDRKHRGADDQQRGDAECRRQRPSGHHEQQRGRQQRRRIGERADDARIAALHRDVPQVERRAHRTEAEQHQAPAHRSRRTSRGGSNSA